MGVPTYTISSQKVHHFPKEASLDDHAPIIGLQVNFFLDTLLLLFWKHHSVLEGNGRQISLELFAKNLRLGRTNDPRGEQSCALTNLC
jgi:hypothetical protein